MVNTPYKVCPNCGQRLVPDMPACGRCGHAFYARPAYRLPRRNFTLPWLITGVLLALCAVAYLGMALRPPSPFVGTWVSTTSGRNDMVQVKPDGTAQSTLINPLSGLPDTARYTWRATGETMVLMRPDQTYSEASRTVWQLTADGKTLRQMREDGLLGEYVRAP